MHAMVQCQKSARFACMTRSLFPYAVLYVVFFFRFMYAIVLRFFFIVIFQIIPEEGTIKPFVLRKVISEVISAHPPAQVVFSVTTSDFKDQSTVTNTPSRASSAPTDLYKLTSTPSHSHPLPSCSLTVANTLQSFNAQSHCCQHVFKSLTYRNENSSYTLYNISCTRLPPS